MKFEPIDPERLGMTARGGAVSSALGFAPLWPPELLGSSDPLIRGLEKVALEETLKVAAAFYNARGLAREAVEADPGLNATGQAAEIQRRTDAKRTEMLGYLRHLRDAKVDPAAKQVEELGGRFGALLTPSSDPAAAVRASEIRTWFRQAEERARLVTEIEQRGDVESAHALVNAPPTMQLLAAGEMDRLRVVVERSASPRDYDRLQQLRVAVAAAVSSLDRAESYLNRDS